jgi:hypothetical protein
MTIWSWSSFIYLFIKSSPSPGTLLVTHTWLAGFMVLRTTGVGDTKKLYVRVARHIIGLYAQMKAGRSNRPGTEPLPTFSEFVAKMSVERKTTIRDAWTCMLCSAPGTTA